MGKIHCVKIDKVGFDVIKDNKNHRIGVDIGCDKIFDLKDLERISQFFIIKSVGIENIFSNRAFPTGARNGDFIWLFLVGENERVDNTSSRILIRINGFYHFQRKLDSLCEVKFSFYEYSLEYLLLTPKYFFNEKTDENSQHACSPVSTGVCG